MGAGVPLGPYSLVRRLAKGGMAEIFLARKEGPEGFARELVVKRILPHLSEDSEFRDLFREEARIVAKLNHANIVNVYDFGEAGGTPYLVMELVRGVDLRALIIRANERAIAEGQPGAIPPHHAAKILSFVCEGLSHAHGVQEEGRMLGLVHRDVTPSNVLVSFDGAVKIGDFGVAKLQRRRGREATQVGMVRGKYAYLSPEQARGEKLDARSDLFNAGILLFEAITGETFYPHDQPKIARGLSAAGKMWHPERIDALPPELADIVRRAVAADRETRYPDALALRAALEKFLRRCPEPSDSVELGNYVRQLFPDAVEQDRVGPRAAGTVPVTGVGTGSIPVPKGTALLTGPAAGTPAAPFATPVDLQAERASSPDDLVQPMEATQPWRTPAASEVYPAPVAQPASKPPRRWLPLAAAALILLGASAAAYKVYLDAQTLDSPEAPAVVASPEAEPEVVQEDPTPNDRAEIRISTFPESLPIRVDERDVGIAPQVVEVSAEERHLIEAIRGSERVAHILLQLGAGESREVVLQAPERAELHVVTAPPGASIEIDGRDAGESPITVEVDPGTHDVIATLEGFDISEQEVETTAGRNNLNIALAEIVEAPEPEEPEPETMRPRARRQRATGTLTVNSTPWSAVYIDGRHYGTTPLSNVRLPAGSHTLSLRNPHTAPVTRRIVVRANAETRIRQAL